MNVKKYGKGDICRIQYQDASYLYRAPKINGAFFASQPLISIGLVRAINKNYIDIAYTWNETLDEAMDGIVIPLKAILFIERLYEK